MKINTLIMNNKVNFERFWRNEIKHIAKKSFASNGVSFHEICPNNDQLRMWHDIHSDQLIFKYTNNSKPYYYKDVEQIEDNTFKVVDKKFEEKYQAVNYDYPYIEEIIPAKMVASSWSLFNVWEYTMIKETKQKKPNFREVENIIYRALEVFKIY